MKIMVEWGYHTDGDFCFNPSSDFDIDFETDIEKYDMYYDYYGMKVFDSNNFESKHHCMFEARGYVQKLLVNTYVSHTHYYVIQYIYRMLEPVIIFINKIFLGTMKGRLLEQLYAMSKV